MQLVSRALSAVPAFSASALAGAAARVALALLLLGGGVSTLWLRNQYTPLLGSSPGASRLVWIPQSGLLPEGFYGFAALALGALLLVGLFVRPALLGGFLFLALVWWEKIRPEPIYEVSRHLLPLAALLLVSWLADPAGRRIGLDGIMRPRAQTEDAFHRNSAALLLLRFLLGSLFLLQAMRSLGGGWGSFAERNYVQPFSQTGLPAPILWAAGLSNPLFQLSGSVLLLTGWRTRLGALLHVIFLLQIVFGHMIADPLEYEGDLQKFGLANFLLALAILLLADRGDGYSCDAWQARRRAPVVRATPRGGLLLAALLALAWPGTAAAGNRVDELLAEAERNRATGQLEDAWESVRLFRAALRLDPRSASAWVGLARAYSSPPVSYSGRGRRLPTREAYARSTAAARRALEIDPLLPEAQAILAQEAMYWRYDWRAAERRLRALRESAPSLLDARLDYARLLGATQRFDAAYAELRQLRELAPASSQPLYLESLLLFFQRRYQESADLLRATRERFPGERISHFLLGLALIETGALREAIDELEQFAAQSDRNPGGIATLACAYARAGRSEKARGILRELDRRAATDKIVLYQYAVVLAELGQVPAALRWLERALREERANWPLFLRQDPRLDPLRLHPRFQVLLRNLFARASIRDAAR